MAEQHQESTKRCPMCGEEVLAVAIKCKHCQSMIGPAALDSGPAASAATSHVQSAPVPSGPATPVRLSFKASALCFWLGSLPGFFVYGVVSGSMFASTWRGERFAWPQTFIMTAFLAVLAGAPLSLVFGAFMRRRVVGPVWPMALGMAAGFTALVAPFMVWVTNALLGDRGYVANVPVFVGIAAIAMTGGALAAMAKASRA